MGQVLKNEPSKICERQSFTNLKGYGLPKAGATFKTWTWTLDPDPENPDPEKSGT